MILGLLSDTHNDLDAARRGIAILDQHGASAFFHCGDLGGERILDELAGRKAFFVWGNCDDPTPSLRRYATALSLTFPPHPPLRVELAGKHIAMCHGHEREYDAALADPTLHYLLHGHTHLREDRRIGPLRIINPGALHRARTKTVATLDLTTDALTFWTLDGQPLS